MPPKNPKTPTPPPGDEPQLQGDTAPPLPPDQADQDAAMAAAAASLAAEQPPATDPPEPQATAEADSQPAVELAIEPDSVTVRVLHRVRRGRVSYGPGQPGGDELTLGADEARELVAAGAAELI
jgi:hypothetical protein